MMLNSSQRYLGEEGMKYFGFQNKGGDRRGRINARKFAPYVSESDRVLDFGCGGGWLLNNLDCAQRVGVEINSAARVVAEGIGIDAHETLCDVDDAAFDLVVSNHALEHVLSPVETLIQLHKKLVPGGRMVLCLPIDDWRAQRTVDESDINNHLYTWSPMLLGNLLREAVFEVDDIWVYTHAWPPRHWQRLDKYLSVRFFDFVCYVTAWRLRRRQVMVVAHKPIAVVEDVGATSAQIEKVASEKELVSVI